MARRAGEVPAGEARLAIARAFALERAAEAEQDECGIRDEEDCRGRLVEANPALEQDHPGRRRQPELGPDRVGRGVRRRRAPAIGGGLGEPRRDPCDNEDAALWDHG